MYEKLGHAEVVQLELHGEGSAAEQQMAAFADTYFSQFVKTPFGMMRSVCSAHVSLVSLTVPPVLRFGVTATILCVTLLAGICGVRLSMVSIGQLCTPSPLAVALQAFATHVVQRSHFGLLKRQSDLNMLPACRIHKMLVQGTGTSSDCQAASSHRCSRSSRRGEQTCGPAAILVKHKEARPCCEHFGRSEHQCSGST